MDFDAAVPRSEPQPQAGNSRAAVLVVVSPGERNWVDQQWLQGTLRDAHGVRTVRYTLAEVASLGAHTRSPRPALFSCGDASH